MSNNVVDTLDELGTSVYVPVDNILEKEIDYLERIKQSLWKMSDDELDEIEHQLFVVRLERDVSPRLAKSHYDEFKEVFLCDALGDGLGGDILVNIQSELNSLSKRKDSGSLERLFFLRKWVKIKFGVDLK